MVRRPLVQTLAPGCGPTKVSWRKLVDELEVEAGLDDQWEIEWKIEGLDVEDEVTGTICSSEVLKEAVANCPFMADGRDATFTPKPSRRHSLCRYRSILRLDTTDREEEKRKCVELPLYLCLARHQSRSTHGTNLMDDSPPSFLLASRSSG